MQKDTAAGGAAAKAMHGENEEGDMIDDPLIGNVYKFSQNRNFYDSLDSIEIYRNEEPEYVTQNEPINDAQQPGGSFSDDDNIVRR